jgi:hypothetical protein
MSLFLLPLNRYVLALFSSHRDIPSLPPLLQLLWLPPYHIPIHNEIHPPSYVLFSFVVSSGPPFLSSPPAVECLLKGTAHAGHAIDFSIGHGSAGCRRG